MSQPTERKFSLGDMMILVAAAALGLLLQRTYLMTPNPHPWALLGGSLYRWLFESCPFLIPASLALVAMRLRRPRPAARRLRREPGLVACLAVIVTEVTRDVQSFISEVYQGHLHGNFYRFIPDYRISGPFFWGYSVALAWSVMVLTGVWRPQPSWIDRAGRALGVLMIALSLIIYFSD